ncbi:MAG: polysaccharide pyruvyl transferase family protein [Chloroflexi bacterium]|nr:polysaccharide pyruvyl transferase family protein [Chloroflexota bacterium]
MKPILPRVIYGNLGDLASRWGVLRALHQLGVDDVTVFRNLEIDVPALPFRALNYRPLRNLRLDREARDAFRRADTVLWAVGLDMQDDSSLVRMMYLWVAFRLYRALGLKIVCLFQGAGPVTTRTGRVVAPAVLSQVDTFVARDPGTFALIEKLNPRTKRVLAHDAIFLPGFEEDLVNDVARNGIPHDQNLAGYHPAPQDQLDPFFKTDGRPIIGINIRQWFHFASSILPYQFSREKYRQRSEAKMQELIRSTTELIASLRARQQARVLLISAYQKDVLPWEDDLPWLARVKASFAADDEVQLVNMAATMPEYYNLMSRLDLMIGMRLHSSLVALRFGVPSINLSYTLKGGDILRHLGLPDSVADLKGFIESPKDVLARAEFMLANREAEAAKVRAAVAKAIEVNMDVLKELLF